MTRRLEAAVLQADSHRDKVADSGSTHELMHRLLHRKGQTYSDDSESLQADVMRFMAIIAFCLIAILALVKHAEPAGHGNRQPGRATAVGSTSGRTAGRLPQPLPKRSLYLSRAPGNRQNGGFQPEPLPARRNCEASSR